MSTLILTLPPLGLEPSTPLEYVLSGDKQEVLGHDHVALDLLPKNCDEVVALVPAPMLSWHSVQLPPGSLPRGMSGERASKRLRAILESLLEDDLLDEPTQLHLALQHDAHSGAAVWVVACDRAWLTAALHSLAGAGLPVRRIVPEYSPQMLAQTVFVSGDVDKPWVAGLTQSDGVDGAVSADMLVCGLGPVALERLHHAQAELRPGAVVMAEPPVVALAERLFKQAVTLQARSERLVLAAQSNWNLAQFELVNLGRDRRWAGRRLVLKAFLYAPQWRPARWALLVTLLVNLIGLNALALREQASLKGKRQAVTAVLTETFPKIPAVVDAPVQMAREVADLQRRSGQASATDMEQLLAQFGQAAPEAYSLTAIDFDASQLRVKGVGVVDAPSLTAKFQAAGLNASAQGEQWLISTGARP